MCIAIKKDLFNRKQLLANNIKQSHERSFNVGYFKSLKVKKSLENTLIGMEKCEISR